MSAKSRSEVGQTSNRESLERIRDESWKWDKHSPETLRGFEATRSRQGNGGK